MSYVMGIDIGTYESKGVLVDQKGKLIIQASVLHHLEIPKPGWAEHDAEHTWWHDFKYLSSSILHEAQKLHGIKPGEIAAVGISSISPAVVPVDAEGNPLRKAILYGVDTRSEKQIRYLNQTIGSETIFQVSGQHLSAQSAGPKILWIREEEPGIYEKTAKFLSGTGYIVYKLTNETVIDRYTAAAYSPLFNIDALDWNPEIAALITDLNKLPRLAWGYEVVGEVTENASIETGLAIGTKIIAGTSDALAESISVGAVHEGDLMLMYGSSTFFILVTDLFIKTKKLWSNLHVTPRLNTVTGGTATAGSITRWLVDQWADYSQPSQGTHDKLTLDQMYSQLSQLAEQSPPGSNGLITLPYFSGERTPLHHANAKGVLFGLSLHHTRKDIYRSALEGISYSIRHNMDEIRQLNMPISRVIAVGGGVKNKPWLQCVSDICQINQVIPKITIGASYGNAFLCALGLGWYNSIEDIEQWVEFEQEICSNQQHFPNYERYYRLYQRLYQQTKELMDEL
jgi:xylulokinase